MSFLFLTGSKMNTFGRGTVSVSPTEAAVAPKANLYDSDPSTPHIAGSAAADSYMRVAINGLTNGGFESGLDGWTDEDEGAAVSSATAVAGEFNSGAGGLKLQSSGASTAIRTQTFTAAAGEYRKASIYIKASGGGSVVFVRIRNLTTGNYLNSSSEWGSSPVAAVTVSATSWTLTEVTYQVESFETCRADTVSIKWTVIGSDGTTYADDCKDIPGVTFASIHGHNYAPTLSPLVQSSDDGSSWTTRATMTIQRPAFYSTFSAIYAEYWQIKLSGTPLEAPYTGEAVLGQYTTCATSPMWGIPKTRNTPGVRTRGPSGRPHVYSYATDPPQDIALTFSARTAAAAKELADGLWLRSGQGLYPVVLVPIDTETDVYFGRFMDPVTVERPFQGIYECTLSLVGDPFPTVGL